MGRVRPAAWLGVVTTTMAEAGCWSNAGARVVAFSSGGDGARAYAAAERLLHQGACALLSFGGASGLAPVARPGHLIAADRVVLPSGQTLATDAAWREALLARLTLLQAQVVVARLAGRDQIALSPGDKRRTFQNTFAAALDTESHAVAAVATAAAVPFLVLRATVDPAEQTRPQSAVRGLAPDGARRVVAGLAQLARCPWEAPLAWRHAGRVRVALAALRQAADVMPSPPEMRRRDDRAHLGSGPEAAALGGA